LDWVPVLVSVLELEKAQAQEIQLPLENIHKR
jgi:hypothetical protein